MFNNQLKRLYNIDKKLLQLKAERKELFNIIEYNKIKKQGRYRLVIDVKEARALKVEEFQKLVSAEDFLKAIVIPVKNAVKYVSEKELMKITYKKTDTTLYVIKE